MSALHTLVYVSTLSADASIDVVATIARGARRRNLDEGITGLLVFDGSSFAQWLEGPADAIGDLVARLQRDRRHFDVEILFHGAVEGPRRYPSWRLGYLLVDAEEASVARLRGLRDGAALQAFEQLLPELDVGVGEAVPA